MVRQVNLMLPYHKKAKNNNNVLTETVKATFVGFIVPELYSKGIASFTKCYYIVPYSQ